MCLCQIRLLRLNKDHEDQATVKRAKKGKLTYAFCGRRQVESCGAESQPSTQ